MQITELAKGELPPEIAELIDVALEEESSVTCEVIISVKPGGKSGTQLTITIDSPVNYDEYKKAIGL